MINAVLRTIERYCMLQNGDTVIVALSGGADSVALLHILYSIKERYNLTLYAAHLNHQLRGDEAERDENFCKILCEKYNIRLFVKRAAVKTLAAEQKISEELCGREERYQFFEALSKNFDAKIATAHTAADNAETLIFNLVRGAGMSGMAGIPPKRGNIIRPLIEQTRENIERYCERNALRYVTDSTNLQDDYTRNRIRHGIIPALKTLNPQFEAAALRLTQSARDTGDFLKKTALDALKKAKLDFGYDAKLLLQNDQAVLHAAIIAFCRREANIIPEQKHVLLIEKILQNGGAVALGGGYTVLCRQDIVRVIQPKTITPDKFQEIAFNKDISFACGKKLITAGMKQADIANHQFVFRTRQSGDRFTYPKRNVTKPLRKVFNEQKIPGELRDNMILLCEGSTVLWCEKLGFSKTGEELKKALEITIDVVHEGE